MTFKIGKSDIRQEKGTWKRFVKLIAKSHIPIPMLILYIVLEITLVNIGINETDLTAQLFAGDTSVGLILKLVVVMIINILCADIVILIRQLTDARTNRNARISVWNKLLKVPMSFFKDTDPQEAITRVVNNASAVGTTLILVVAPIITSGYGIIAAMLKVFEYDWRLSLILLAFLPISLFLAFITGRLKRSVSNSGANIAALLTEHLSELIHNIPLTKAFAKEKYEQERGNEDIKKLYAVDIKSGWIDKVGELAFSISDLLQTIIIVVIGAVLIDGGDISTRAWVAFFMFSTVFTTNIQNLVMYWHNSKNIQGIVTRAADIMEAKTEPENGETAEKLSGNIEISDLEFSYDDENIILSGVNCTIEQGKTTVLLGKSGCGKSTLVNLIDRIYTPAKGKITIGGKDITDYQINSYRSRFGVVSQNIMLFSGSIRENLCLGTDDLPDDTLYEVLKKVGLYDFVNNSEDKLDTDIGEQGDRLSGGQKQKLGIARLMLSKPDYIILDESTASMDSVAVGEIRSILKDYLVGKTVIIIAHGPQLLSLADNAVVIENGKISAQGSIEEVKASNRFCSAVMKGAEKYEG